MTDDEKQAKQAKDKFDREAMLILLQNQVVILETLKIISFQCAPTPTDTGKLYNTTRDMCSRRTQETLNFLKHNIKLDD